MIWQFEELGYDYSIDYNGRTGEKPIRWDYYNDPARKRLHDVLIVFISLHREQSLFAYGNPALEAGGAVKTLSIQDTSMQAFIAGNFEATPRRSRSPSPPPAPGMNISGEPRPGEYLFNTTRKLSQPDLPLALPPLSQEELQLEVSLYGTELHISLGSKREQSCIAELLVPPGQTLSLNTLQLIPGENRFSLSLTSPLHPGVYILGIIRTDRQTLRKIPVQENRQPGSSSGNNFFCSNINFYFCTIIF